MIRLGFRPAGRFPNRMREGTMNHFTPAIDRQKGRSGVEELMALLLEAHTWRMRAIELAFASVTFFWLGFFIAARCL
jgi:hypothetical protein